jgi:hypothetical protein
MNRHAIPIVAILAASFAPLAPAAAAPDELRLSVAPDAR